MNTGEKKKHFSFTSLWLEKGVGLEEGAGLKERTWGFLGLALNMTPFLEIPFPIPKNTLE